MPGPPPKDPAQRRRRNTGPELLKLPAEGRTEPAPDWPLELCTAGELDTWRALWSTPQAVAWARMGVGLYRVVARYVRLLRTAEGGGDVAGYVAADTASEVRQLEDRLGLTPMSMKRLGWEIVADEVAAARSSSQPAASAGTRRLRAVDGDAVAGT